MTIINTNTGAIQAQASMQQANNAFSSAMTKLSSGMRINAAKDDAAGMAIAEKMTSQVMGLNQAVRNATDGKNLVDTTEGAHVEVTNMLQRLRELAVQSANDTNTGSNRTNIQSEGNALINEINRVAETTTFNGMKVLDGSFTGKQLQIGADSGQVIRLDIDSASATSIGGNFVNSAASVVGSASTKAGENLTISGNHGSATVAVTAGMSAKDVAGLVNGVESSTGVSATAVTKAKLSGLSAAGSITMDINGTSIGNVAITDTTDMRSLRDAINSYSGVTGVSATMGDTNGEIVLTSATGEDISITNFDHSGASGETLTVDALNADGTASGATTNTSDLTQGGTDLATVTGQVTYSSAKAFVVASDASATDGSSFTENAAEASDLTSVAEIDLTTVEGAGKAIKVLDMALEKIGQQRSDLGAVSNRLDSTIANLTNISANTQAAKSNVMDADFAQESTNLARGQILTQAATAMLAQANSSKQGVLSLLRG
jgi:flagellin